MSHDDRPALYCGVFELLKTNKTCRCTPVEFTHAVARKPVYENVIENLLLYQPTAFDKHDKTGKDNKVEEIPDLSPALLLLLLLLLLLFKLVKRQIHHLRYNHVLLK